ELRQIIEDSLGPAEGYPIIRGRGSLLKAAADLGVRTPESAELASKDDLDRWPMSSGVLKLDGSWGGNGVEIAATPNEIAAAYKKLAKPRGIGFSIKRLLINCDPLAFWFWKNGRQPRITI